jgi:hypothetical protein
MKSAEAYSLLKSEFAPWFKSEGFKRAKAMLSWSRPHGDLHTVVWCQVSQDGWDSLAGSQFTVELQRSFEPVVGIHDARRERFFRFLSQVEREQLRSIQNAVISKLHRPPPSHPILQSSKAVSDYYLKKFETISEPYPEKDDVWFRYACSEDVKRWAHFIMDKLPRLVVLAEDWPTTAP